MPATELRQRPGNMQCGMSFWHPPWMQRFATTKMFMAVYGLLGTIQAMSYMYFIVTLTTIEKRFKIPSQTTGIILSGNEISQILLSLVLSYVGGQRNRPRWIAWGIVFCGISCFILALPHFIYGAGQDVLQLTKEYLNDDTDGSIALSLVNSTVKHTEQLLCASIKLESECDALLSIVPLILIFLSQFVLGIGNTLYYSLGQTYLDDNTKKTNTPLMLAVAMSLRMIGPIVGFFLGYVSLNMFIDPTMTPLIDNKDPRWLGAWWFGWMILGTLMVLFSGLIGLFPKELPKTKSIKYNSHMPQVLLHDEPKFDDSEDIPLGRGFSSNPALDTIAAATSDFPKMKDFPKALMRLLRNKLLIFNIISAVFYILGAAGYMTFLTKYMEVQFHKNAQSATIIVGPVSIIGMVIGLIASGLVISKKKPSPSKVLMWNVIVGVIYIFGQISYMFMYCPDSVLVDGKLNLTTSCNSNCECDGVSYSPICHDPSATTYFSPCHAGCNSWNSDEKFYSNCSCVQDVSTTTTLPTAATSFITLSTTQTKAALQRNIDPVVVSTSSKPFLTLTTEGPVSTILTSLTSSHWSTIGLSTSTIIPTVTTTTPIEADYATTTTTGLPHNTTSTPEESLLTRSRRSIEALVDVLTPGVCLESCNRAFWTFSLTSMIVNWFGSSGRIGNILVNYRSVSTEDKSFAQGLTLMMISLFSLIPGPIIFGRLIDSTCLVWTKTCSGNGNCQLYDQDRFRYLVNSLAFSLTIIGVLFDVLVWYHGRHLDLYGEKEAQRLEEERRKDKTITPLLSRK